LIFINITVYLWQQ